jgi:hypothetical protein
MFSLLLGAFAVALPGQSTSCKQNAVNQCTATCADIGECIFGCEVGSISSADTCSARCSTLGSLCLDSCLRVTNQIANCAYVTGEITVNCGTLVYNRATQVWQQTVRITNTSTADTMDFVGFVLDSLVAGWTLTNGDGVTAVLAPAGSPYKNLGSPVISNSPSTGPGGDAASLAPGASTTVTLTFTRTGTPSFGYIPRVVTSQAR